MKISFTFQRKLKNAIGVIFILWAIIYPVYFFTTSSLKKSALDSKAIKTQALIIDEKNFLGNNPVAQTYTFSYSFEVDGKLYKGDSKDPDYKIGDKLLIEYLKIDPSNNRPIKK